MMKGNLNKMGAAGAFDIKRKCPVCLKEFWAAKQKAVYCSDKCRQRAHRRPPLESRIKDLYDDAHTSIMGLVAVSDRSGNGLRAQQRLKALFLEIINNVDDTTRRAMYEAIKDDLYRVVYRDSSVSRYRPENSNQVGEFE